HDVERIELLTVFVTELLQVVEQLGLDGPASLVGLFQQGRQYLKPFGSLFGSELQRPLQAQSKILEVAEGGRSRVLAQGGRSHSRRTGALDRCPYQVAFLRRSIGMADQSPVIGV